MIQERYHTFWRRFWAGTIDAFVFVFVIDLPMFVVGLALSDSVDSAVHTIRTYWLDPLLMSAYSIAMHGWRGQTLGKMATRVIVRDVSGSKLSWRQAFYRDALPVVMILITGTWMYLAGGSSQSGSYTPSTGRAIAWAYNVWFVAELLTMLTNSRRRAIHDYIAGSVVTKQAPRTETAVAQPA